MISKLLEILLNLKYFLIIFLILPNAVYACSWNGDPTKGVSYENRVIDYIKNADYVFIGTIDKYEWKPNPDFAHDRPWHYHEINIDEVFKGALQGTIEYWPSTSCDMIFSREGEEFVMFGYKTENNIQFPILAGSIYKSEAIEIGLIEQLRKIKQSP